MTAVVGLTGGIGSGKTAVANAFSKLGVRIVDADVEARNVVNKGSDALKAIVERYSDKVLVNGELNRAALRKIIFDNDAERIWLESLTHPLIRAAIEEKLKTMQGTYCLLVSPLLLETDQHELCDRVLVVDVPVKIQIERAAKRDNSDQNSIKAIIAAQMQRNERLLRADDIIDNSGSPAQTQRHVERLHTKYTTLTRS